MGRLVDAFAHGHSKLEALRATVDRFLALRGTRVHAQVAIFGDLYVRDNEVMSQDLVRFIESHGRR